MDADAIRTSQSSAKFGIIFLEERKKAKHTVAEW